MDNNFVFGRYIKRDTFLHRLDPRVKLVCFILFLICIFIKKSFVVYFFLLGLFTSLFILAMLPRNILSFFGKIFLIMIFFLLIFNFAIAFISSPPAQIAGKNNIIYKYKNFFITYSGFINTFYYALRVALVVIITMILVSTTRAVDLTNAIAFLLKPLRIIRFPTQIFAMIIVLTLRLVSTLVEEANSIMDAQASRGLDFQNGNLRVKVKALISLLIPLLISIFKRAEEMALALESRGYNPYNKRTSYHNLMLRRCDYIIFAVNLIIFGFIFAYLFAFSWFGDVQSVFILELFINQKIN